MNTSTTGSGGYTWVKVSATQDAALRSLEEHHQRELQLFELQERFAKLAEVKVGELLDEGDTPYWNCDRLKLPQKTVDLLRRLQRWKLPVWQEERPQQEDWG